MTTVEDGAISLPAIDISMPVSVMPGARERAAGRLNNSAAIPPREMSTTLPGDQSRRRRDAEAHAGKLLRIGLYADVLALAVVSGELREYRGKLRLGGFGAERLQEIAGDPQVHHAHHDFLAGLDRVHDDRHFPRLRAFRELRDELDAFDVLVVDVHDGPIDGIAPVQHETRGLPVLHGNPLDPERQQDIAERLADLERALDHQKVHAHLRFADEVYTGSQRRSTRAATVFSIGAARHFSAGHIAAGGVLTSWGIDIHFPGRSEKVWIRSFRATWLVARCGGAVLLCATLFACGSLRYVRTENVAGSVFVDRLVLDGPSFRLERMSDEGRIVYIGRYAVDGDQWTFQITSWRSDAGQSHRIDPPLLFVCRGKSFDNGVAFFDTPSGSTDMDAFLDLPSDFDLQP